MKYLNKLYWKMRIIGFSIPWIFCINLGDNVKFEGKKHQVVNVKYDNSFGLIDLYNVNRWANRIDCRKIFSPFIIKKNFCKAYNFYMKNWFVIWCNEGMKPWMRKCRIWK